MQGMMRAVSDAAPKRSARLDHDKAERPIEARQAGDRGGGSGESTADHAHREWRRPHLTPSFRSSSFESLGRIKPPNKDLDMTACAEQRRAMTRRTRRRENVIPHPSQSAGRDSPSGRHGIARKFISRRTGGRPGHATARH
jgi:hypothetical protein